MRVDGSVPLLRQALAAALEDATARAGVFASSVEVAAATASPLPQVATVPAAGMSVEMLVTMAALDPGIERRRRIAAEAERGLSMLERLRDAMAAGDVPPDGIEEMRAWVAGFTPPDDPLLASIARDIELRIRIELARYDVRV